MSQLAPRRQRDPQRVWGDAETARLAGIMTSAGGGSGGGAADGTDGTDGTEGGEGGRGSVLNESTTTTTASDC